MKQPIAGVGPATLSEITVMTVWPSVAATRAGRRLGQLWMIRAGEGVLPLGLTLGTLLAGASIPLVLPLIFAPFAGELLLRPLVGLARRLGATGLAEKLASVACRRYRLTNQRVVIQRGLQARDERSIALDAFDAIEVEVLPGQAWYPAGELIFRRDTQEVFRLSGVPRPETFRQTCLKAHQSFVGVQQAREKGLAV